MTSLRHKYSTSSKQQSAESNTRGRCNIRADTLKISLLRSALVEEYTEVSLAFVMYNRIIPLLHPFTGFD
jgi:hypothetical protein